MDRDVLIPDPLSDNYADKAVIKLLAERNWRGVPIADLVASIQAARDKLAMLEIDPFSAIGFQCPSDCPQGEWIESHRYHWECITESIIAEIKRRRAIRYDLRQNPDKEIIAAIKERIPIADVLEWYTEVIVPKGSYRGNWQFRCTLHGEDKNPSGVIYIKEQRWWCFGCNKGGDIFDAVQAFEKIDLPQAIAKLARHIGLDTKPIFRKPVLQVRGGAIL